MSHKKRISVAMAVFNGEEYLNCQIDSILKQLRYDDELVISYDDSSDRTWDIITNYASSDERVRVLHNRSAGIATNFCNAITGCEGSIIFISDQDDLWLPNKVASVLQVFSEQDVGLVIHNGQHTDRNLNPVGESFFSMYNVGPSLIRNFVRPRYSGCCMAFRSELRNRIVPFPHGIDAYDHWIGMIGEVYSRVYFLDEVLILHRLHGGNVTPPSSRSPSKVACARLHLLFCLMKAGLERRWSGAWRRKKSTF